MTLPDKAAKEAAARYASYEPVNHKGYSEEAFLAGAQWRLTQILGMLRSDGDYEMDLAANFIERELKGES